VVRNVPPAFSSKEGAQKYVEQIYTLISENQNAKALQLFNSQREPLRKFLEPEAYQVLQNSFAQ